MVYDVMVRVGWGAVKLATYGNEAYARFVARELKRQRAHSFVVRRAVWN